MAHVDNDNTQLFYTIETTAIFDKWLSKLKNLQAKMRIVERIMRIKQDGFFGDVEPVGEGISELRIHSGAGYRIYFIQRNDTIILLLCGGDKDSQQDDIKKAKQMVKELNHAN